MRRSATRWISLSLAATLASLLVEGSFDKRTSFYLCLAAVPELCLSINDRAYEAQPLVLLRPKATKSEAVSRRMHWSSTSTNDERGSLWLQESKSSPSMCLNIVESTLPNSHPVSLAPCHRDASEHPQWEYLESGEVRFVGNGFCLTLHKCPTKTSTGECDPDHIGNAEKTPSMASEGFLLRLNPCNQDNKKPENAPAQRWTQVRDCAPGCAPWMLGDGGCDAVCRPAACGGDQEDCTVEASTASPSASSTSVGKTSAPSVTQPDNAAGTAAFVLAVLALLVCAGCVWRRRRLRRASRAAHGQGLGEDDGLEIFGTGTRGIATLHDSGAGQSHRARFYEPFGGGDARFATQSAVAMNQLRYHSRNAGGSASEQHQAPPRPRTEDTSDAERVKNFVEIKLV